jgi:hypothetical protein
MKANEKGYGRWGCGRNSFHERNKQETKLKEREGVVNIRKKKKKEKRVRGYFA